MRASSTHLPPLLPGEEIVNVKSFAAPRPEHLPTSLAMLTRLAGARKSRNIGKFGPVLAALPLQQHRKMRTFRQFEALFGRDSMRVASDLISKFPHLASSTLLALAEQQGIVDNAANEEEPGKIPHEVRHPKTDPIARALTRQDGWTWPYYGSVDATPAYVSLLVSYCQSSTEGFAFLHKQYIDRDRHVATIALSLERAVDWLTRSLDRNAEGLLEYCRRNPHGIENQVWRDSWDAYFHADGTMANHTRGIASVEVQSAAYDALEDAAFVYEMQLQQPDRARELRARATRLKQAIFAYFWVDERGGYFALGTDRDDHGHVRKLKIRTSNMGHLLHSRLLMDETPETARMRDAIITQLFSPEMLCRNGIRTLASDEVRFRPGAYHDGSCWAWDNYMIAQGLDMHGYTALGDYLEQIIVADVRYARRYIEFMRGDNDPEYRINANIVDVWDENNQRLNQLEQPPQDMQAWTAAAVLAIQGERRERRYSRLSYDPAKRELEKRVLGSIDSTWVHESHLAV